jgi:hypothetical protein
VLILRPSPAYRPVGASHPYSICSVSKRSPGGQGPATDETGSSPKTDVPSSSANPHRGSAKTSSRIVNDRSRIGRR